MMNRLHGRRALVTGGASGIGKATAHRLAEEGAAVMVTDVQDDAGEQVAADLRAKGYTVVYRHHDVADEAQWREAVAAAVDELGGLDILVNNAGIGDLGTIEETDLADYERIVGVTQRSVFLGMKHAAEALKAAGNAAVINVSSIFGVSGGFGTSPAYHAAKGAVRTLTKNVALAWATQGVRVNSVHPGFVDTPILGPAMESGLGQALVDVTPMGRLGRPEEIAAVIAFLASDDASFMTGSEVHPDGGYLAR